MCSTRLGALAISALLLISCDMREAQEPQPARAPDGAATPGQTPAVTASNAQAPDTALAARLALVRRAAGGVEAVAPMRRFVARLDDHGALRMDAQGAPAPLRVSLRAWGREGDQREVAEASSSQVNGPRVEYAREGGLTEWYVNRAEGLEHGFVLEERPAGDAPLTFTLDVSGATLSQGANRSVVASAGAVQLAYQGLKVWDVNKRPIEASMRVEGQQIVLSVEDRDAVYPLTVDPVWIEVNRILASDGDAGARFGTSVRVAGARAIAGARGKNGDQGAAYILERDAAGVWQQRARLLGSDSVAGDQFGQGADVDGDFAIVGAPLHDSAAVDGGAAYIFRRQANGTWTQEQKLTAPGAGADWQYGRAVTISGSYAAVGAPNRNSTDDGRVYVYERSGAGAWSLVATLSDGDTFEESFGTSVDMEGSTLVVGSPNVFRGALISFRRDAAGVWGSKQRLEPAATYDECGERVALHGNTAVLACPDPSTNSRKLFIYTRPDATSAWSQLQQLNNDGASGFATSVAIEGDLLAVGAPSAGGGGTGRGAIQVFTRTTPGGTFGTRRYLLSSSAADGAGIGQFVALSQGRVLGAAVVDDTQADDAGAIYNFNVEPLLADQMASTSQGVSRTFTLKVQAGEPAPARFDIVTQPANGTITGSSPTYTYTPNPGFVGQDMFRFSTFDGTHASSQRGLVHVTVNPTGAHEPETKLLSAESVDGDALGRAVALDGDRMILGMSGNGNGHAVVFERSAQGTWEERGRFSTDGAYGAAVAIHGDHAIVSAPKQQVFFSEEGRVFFYARQPDGSWRFVSRHESPDTNIRQGFGTSVAIEGDTALVGTTRGDGAASYSGVGFIFTRDAAGVWTRTQKLNALDGALNDELGYAVALDGSRAFISTIEKDSNRGAVYIFERDALGVWQQVQKLVASDRATNDQFGISITASGDELFIGANEDDDGAANSGSVYVFNRGADGVWLQAQKLTAQKPAAELRFGRHVSFSNGELAVSEHREGTPGTGKGKAYIFKKDSAGSWRAYKRFEATDGEATDEFGFGLAIDSGRLLAGAGFDDELGNNTGAAYTYDLGANRAPSAQNASLTTAEDTALSFRTPGTDPDGVEPHMQLVVPPAHGTITGTGPAYVYTPDANYNGPDSFTFRAHDGFAPASAIATVNITVTPVNDAPVATGTSVTTAEDTAVEGAVSATDVEGDTLTFSIVGQPSNGTVTITNASTGAFRYTPDANYNGADSFRMRARDGSANSNTVTVSVTVTPVNDAPVAINGNQTTTEDTPVSGALAATDVEGDALTYAIVGQASNGTVVITNASTGAYTYSPAPNYAGADSFTFRVNDGSADSNTATVSLVVTPTSDPPVAVNGNLTTTEDTAGSGILTASDPDGDALTYAIVAQPSNGAVVITNAATGAYTYTPASNYSGMDSFTFRASDAGADSNTATVTITVTAVNDAPVASNGTLTAVEDTSTTGTLAATDVEGDTLAYTIVAQPTNGTVTITDAATGAYTYTPNADYAGMDSFTFRANDGNANSNIATLTITVTNTNDLPVAVDSSASTQEDVALSGTLVATDADGDALTYAVVAQPANGAVIITDAATGAYTYAPAVNYTGMDSFTFSANDGTGDSNVATITITVGVDNDAPVADDLTLSVDEDTVITDTLVATDVEGDALTFTIVAQPTNGTVVITDAATGAFTYTPNADYTGDDTFTFRANDGVADSNVATVTITFAAVNDAPVADDLTISVDEDASVSDTLTATDADGDALTFTIVAQPANGAVVITDAATGAFTYTPNADYAGDDTFTFVANDGEVDSSEATVTITIGVVNDAPSFVDPTPADGVDLAVVAGQVVTFALDATDPDGDALSFEVNTLPTGATFDTATRVFTWTPRWTDAGALTLTLLVTDGVAQVTRTITVTVTAADTDGDGVFDDAEVELGLDPNSADTDGDTIADGAEVGADLTTPSDTDRDGTIDARDDDSDGDGISDADEAGDADLSTAPADTDGDGTPDFQDTDSDADTIEDASDNCTLVANTDQVDVDTDGIGDACDDEITPPGTADKKLEGDGCGCTSVQRRPQPFAPLQLAGLGLLGLVVWRRRRAR